MSNLTIDRATLMANLMLAFRNGDIKKYEEMLRRCEPWMDEQYYIYFFNLGKSSVFTRKGYYKI